MSFKLIFLLSTGLLISACGGGGDSPESIPTQTPTPTPNSTPVAKAGTDQAIDLGSVVNLGGLDSSDSDGDALTYLWSLDAKPTDSASIINTASVGETTFVPDAAGTYTIGLVVNDGFADSVKDTIIITVEPPNRTPIAVAGPDRSVVVGSNTTLDGSDSIDPDLDSLTYLWSFESKPNTSSATLTDSTTSSPSFTPDVSGAYTLNLIVNDGVENSIPNTVVITGDANSNITPEANAGSDLVVYVGTLATLVGAGSSDDDGDTLSYQWSGVSPATSTSSFNNSTLVNPTFIPDIAGTYTINLVVNDGTIESFPDTVIITALSIPFNSDIVVYSGDTFLGCWSCSQFGSDSIHNSFSQYGSAFSSVSIRNDFSQYGSAFSSKSACNSFASNPPSLIDNNFYYGNLSINQFNSDSICNIGSSSFSSTDCSVLQNYCAN
jgi:hypothetical protein